MNEGCCVGDPTGPGVDSEALSQAGRGWAGCWSSSERNDGSCPLFELSSNTRPMAATVRPTPVVTPPATTMPVLEPVVFPLGVTPAPTRSSVVPTKVTTPPVASSTMPVVRSFDEPLEDPPESSERLESPFFFPLAEPFPPEPEP